MAAEPQDIGAEGYGLLNELLRHGVDVKADITVQPGATQYHVTRDQTSTVLQVHLATGVDIARWQKDPRFRQVATSTTAHRPSGPSSTRCTRRRSPRWSARA